MTIDKRLMQPLLHSFRSRIAGRLNRQITPTPATPPDGTTIANTPNLMAWYKADAMGTNYQSGAEVTTWGDSSGNGLTLYAHNQDGFYYPHWRNPWVYCYDEDFIAPKWYSNQLNGKPIVRFNCIRADPSGYEWSAVTTQVESPQSASSAGFAAFIVYRRITDYEWETAGVPLQVWEKFFMGVRSTGNGEKNIYFRLHHGWGGNWGVYCGLYVHPNWAVWAGTLNPETGLLVGYKNGAWASQSTNVPKYMDYGKPRISLVAGYMSSFDIAEVAIFGRGITHNEVVNISNELKTKYAIT
jgi:hypothetical protein